MFLSIIIPIWNDEKYLEECLDSCLDQELPKNEYEVICVDDGSTDRTAEILQKYAERYPNIKIITKRHGPQFGNGRVIGMNASRADYIWFVDHDDIVAPGALDVLYAHVQRNPNCDRIAFPCYEFFYSLTEEEAKRIKDRTLISNDNNMFQDLVTWSSIIRLGFLREHDILPRSKRIDEAATFWGIKDYHIWSGDTIFLDECLDKGIQTLRITGRPLYHYRRHENTETLSTDPEMVERRKIGKRNTGLLWAYLAYQQKQIYNQERDSFGRASQETTDKTIEKVQRAVNYLLDLPSRQWRFGFRRLKQKHILFSRMPEEYSLSFRTYWRWCSKKERLLPSTYASYYSITIIGARLTRLFQSPFRWRRDVPLHKKMKIAKKQHRLLSTDLSQLEKS